MSVEDVFGSIGSESIYCSNLIGSIGFEGIIVKLTTILEVDNLANAYGFIKSYPLAL